MSVYMTEEEQIEAIKKWWHKYSHIITVLLSVILISFAAYRYWTWHTEKVNLQASNLYERLMNAFSNEDDKAAVGYANQLVKEYQKTVYSDSAHLALAKIYVKQKKYKAAREQLNAIIKQGRVPALKQVAAIRNARVLMAEQNYQNALAQLSPVYDASYQPVILELKGDLYAAMSQYNKAFSQYQKAITDSKAHGGNTLLLEMKANDMASMNQSSKQKQSMTKTA